MIKKWIITLYVSVLLIAGIVGSADAYTASVSYFFEGIELDTGKTYNDPTILVVFQGKFQDIDKILKPKEKFSSFNPSVDFYFEFGSIDETSLGTSLVFDIEDSDPTPIVEMSLLNIPFDEVDYSMMGCLDFTGLSTVSPIDNLTLVFLTADERFFKIGNFEQDGFKIVFEVEEVIPEPSTLLLLGLGLLGFMGVRRWRRKGKRGRKGTMRLLLLVTIGATAGVLLWGGAQPVAAQDDTCIIDLQNDTPYCDTVPAISFIYGPTDNEVVMKITLNPTDYTRACFYIKYGSPPTGYTVNIGDSHSNNGHGGDGGDQHNDAEMMILNAQMSVYGNDDAPHTPSNDHIPLLTKDNMVAQETTLFLKASNNRLIWDNDSGEAGQYDSEYLYALNGQPDSEGPVNYDIYAAFNRVIDLGHDPNRRGSGVTKVTIMLSKNVCDIVTEIPRTECEALSALYNSTAGDEWNNNSGWLDTNTPCSWYGVTCSSATGGYVTELDLPDNKLKGNIPPELGNLNMLTRLDLNANKLSGSIPPELGNLANLQHLDLNANQLTGSIPPELGSLANLQSFDLNDNQQLSGSLPANLTNLTSLQSFRFNNTNLCEPDDPTFQNWLIGISYVGTGVACTNYFGYEDWGGTWHDVDQNGDYGWAAVTSNVLAWTEWGTPELDTVEKIFGDFSNHWTSGNGLMKYGWQWWFDGSTETPSGGEWEWTAVSGGGGHWTDYNVLDQYEYWGNWETMQGIEYYLNTGYGVSITAYPDFTDPGHAFTVWGYESHPNGMGTDLWMTDSADSTEKLSRFSLSYDPDTSLWYINDGKEYRKWYIGGVQALNRKDALNEPDTFVIAAISAPHGGISPEGNEQVQQGHNKTFTIGHPDYSLQELLVDGNEVDCVPTGAGTCEYTFENVNEYHTIQAIFLPEPEMVAVKASAGPDGSILPNGDVKVAEGEDLTFMIIPDPGYRIMDVLVDEKSRGPAITYTLENIKTDHTIEARFTDKTNLLAVIIKKCIEVDDYEEETEIACNGVNAEIRVGDQEFDIELEEDQGVVPFSKSRALVLKVSPKGYLVRWETVDGTIVEGAISTEEDLILRLIIRVTPPGHCSHC